MQKAKLLKIDINKIDEGKARFAVNVLRNGGLVAFPTETVYGLGADALNSVAVKKIFDVKSRPPDNPLIVHIASIEYAMLFAENIPDKGKKLAEAFWPGPLTLILKKKENIPSIVTANLDTVALRVPNHPVILFVLQEFGGGIVGPSANVSGKPSPTSAEHVLEDLGDKIDVIIDSGPTDIGIESTVVDVTIDPPMILRLGGLSRELIESIIGKIGTSSDDKVLQRSPGTRHKHYAPNAQVILFPENGKQEFLQLIKKYESEGKKVGMILHSDVFRNLEIKNLFIAINSSIEHIARNIFRALRELDKKEVDVILVESVSEKGIGASVMDRLRKASIRD